MGLELSFHPLQQKIYEDTRRFKVISCGRRFGKTVYAAQVAIIEGMKHKNGEIILVSPTFSQTQIIYNMIMKRLPEHYIKSKSVAEKYVELISGTRIYAKSGDNPDSMRGYGPFLVVLDEAAMLKEEVWKEVLRPALADNRGKAIIISCLVGDSYIYTGSGMKQIGEVAGSTPAGEYREYGEVVSSAYPKDEIASHTYTTGMSETVKITSTAGYSLEGTLNHPIWCMSVTGNPEWRCLSDVKPGDWIAIKRGMDMWGEDPDISEYECQGRQRPSTRDGHCDTSKITTDMAYLFGVLLGDGYVDYSKLYRIAISTSPEETDMHHFLKSSPCGLRFKQADDYHWVASNKKFVGLLEHLGFSKLKAKEKYIPESLMCASKETVRNLLSGLFDTDGSAHGTRGTVTLASSSPRMIRQVQLLLLNFGIVSRLRKQIAEPTKKVAVCSTVYYIEMTSHNADRFYSEIGFRLSRKQKNRNLLSLCKRSSCRDGIPNQQHRIAKIRKGARYKGNVTHNIDYLENAKLAGYPKVEEFLERTVESADTDGWIALKELYNQHYFWDKIKDVGSGFATTYDLVVPTSHAFVSNGFISHNTPKGYNWFNEIFQMGNTDDPQYADYISFQYSSYDNPFLDPKELDEMSMNLPELVYKQEILAEFIEGGGVVFRNFTEVLRDCLEAPQENEDYVGGADLGRREDFTVISVMKRRTREIVYLERFNKLDWDFIKSRITTVSKMYNGATMFVDSTGMGDPVYEDLAKKGANVRGVKISSASKPTMINALSIMIENKQIWLPNDQDLKKEFQSYTYTMTPDGNVKYGAPPGNHDDIVMSIALIAYGVHCYTECIGMIQPEPVEEEDYWKEEDENFIDWEEDEESVDGDTSPQWKPSGLRTLTND